MLDINWNPSRRDLRHFAGIWLPAFAAVAGTVVYRSGGVRTGFVVWAIAAVIAAIGVSRPDRIRPLFVGWMAAAFPIGWIVSHVILAGVYFVLFTAVGLLMRVFRYDPLDRARRAGSYWKVRPEPGEPETYFRQF